MEMCKYKSYLEELDYPNIDIFTDEQITDTFSSENRYFLLKWLVQNLNSEFPVPLDLSEASANLFADLFYESGFCTSAQKLLFVKGSKKLTLKEQISIFDRIFTYLQNNFEKENVEPKRIISSTEDLELFLNKDVNLFPTMGTLKSYSLKDREEKFKFYKEKIREMNNKIENVEHDNNQNENDISLKLLDERDQRQSEKNIESFKEEAIKLKDIASNIQTNKNVNVIEKKHCFKSDFGNKLANCNSTAESVSQYFQKVNLIQCLNGRQYEEEKINEENEIYEILKQNTDISIDVLEMSKEY